MNAWLTQVSIRSQHPSPQVSVYQLGLYTEFEKSKGRFSVLSVLSQVPARESSSPVKLRGIHWWFPGSIPVKKGENVALLYGTACEISILVDCWFWGSDSHVIYVERLMKVHRSRISFFSEPAWLSIYMLFRSFHFWVKGHDIVLVYATSYMPTRICSQEMCSRDILSDFPLRYSLSASD